ncbi:MAG TPA: hypothetical protein VLH19_01590 [Patescibacteria group bacterium]|nr:hypothetical protein [Patescibacteria group bacterium]
MKKEVSIAIALGVIVGLVVMYGVIRAKRAVEEVLPSPTINPSGAAITATPTPDLSTSEHIRLSEPTNDSLVSTPDIHVTGQTIPNSTVLILDNTREYPSVSDQNGNFSVAVTLEAGANTLVARVLTDDGQTYSIMREIIYSTADIFATSIPTPTATPKATASATIKKK